jgi:hypothetical protein
MINHTVYQAQLSDEQINQVNSTRDEEHLPPFYKAYLDTHNNTSKIVASFGFEEVETGLKWGR